MAQIFVSHSGEDVDLKNFFSNAFAGTKVKGIFEEFEKIPTGRVTSEQIVKDIGNSKAVFVILGPNVQDIPYTRDWVVWETGVAKNKDIWVFEPYSQFGRISVVTPYLKHYVIFDTNDAWLGYIRGIIESYDDSHVLPTLLVTGGIGALLAEKDKIGGAALGTLAGLVISDKLKERPTGIGVVCSNCSSSYNIHIPQGVNTFRCPVCNKHLKIEM
ncbi:MAG: hypothetical protein DDT29_02311 [Dehalococcoidia bacterium]|nr:hypothetical protein [Bacillota bacterium]